jgi:molybdopterin synthase sulfur carrier subunit
MPTVVVPPPYQGPTQGKAEIDVSAATVRESIDAVERLYPGFKPLVIDPTGEVHHFVKLFLNGDQLAKRDALEHHVDASDRIEVLSAIAGG